MAEPQKHIRQAASFVWNLSMSVTRHDIASLASIIAFYAFFSLFPLLVLVIYGASVFVPHTPVEKFLLELLHAYFPAFPKGDGDGFIDQNVSRLIDVGSQVGLVSAVTLLWSATSGFIAVQHALDVIFEHVEPRSFLTRRFIAFVMLLVLLLVTVTSALFIAVFPSIKLQVLQHLYIFHFLFALQRVSRMLFPVSLFIGCFVFYRFLPSRKTPATFALAGSFVATLLLDVGRSAFVWYASHLVRYQLIYGTLTVVMLLVLWMYLASMVLLFGAEVSAAMQTASTSST